MNNYELDIIINDILVNMHGNDYLLINKKYKTDLKTVEALKKRMAERGLNFAIPAWQINDKELRLKIYGVNTFYNHTNTI